MAERIRPSSDRTAKWRAFGAACAIALYAISVSNLAYELTTPVQMPHHVALRKIYAILAFALLGFALERSNFRPLRGVATAGIALAAYSYAIEIGQIVIDHSYETFAQHGFDVASGLAGGELGAFVALLVTAPARRARRFEAVAIVIAFIVLVWGFTMTYGPLG